FAQTDWELLSSADLPLKARTLRNQISHQTFQVVAGSKGTLVEVSITDLVKDDDPSIVLNSGEEVSISILHAAERAAVAFGPRASWLDGSGTWVSPAPQRKLDTWLIKDETSEPLAAGDQ